MGEARKNLSSSSVMMKAITKAAPATQRVKHYIHHEHYIYHQHKITQYIRIISRNMMALAESESDARESRAKQATERTSKQATATNCNKISMYEMCLFALYSCMHVYWCTITVSIYGLHSSIIECLPNKWAQMKKRMNEEEEKNHPSSCVLDCWVQMSVCVVWERICCGDTEMTERNREMMKEREREESDGRRLREMRFAWATSKQYTCISDCE